MAKLDKNRVQGEQPPQNDTKLVKRPTPKNSYDSRYQSPADAERKSIKVYKTTDQIVDDIKYKTKESKIDIYSKAIEMYKNTLDI